MCTRVTSLFPPHDFHVHERNCGYHIGARTMWRFWFPRGVSFYKAGVFFLLPLNGKSGPVVEPGRFGVSRTHPLRGSGMGIGVCH